MVGSYLINIWKEYATDVAFCRKLSTCCRKEIYSYEYFPFKRYPKRAAELILELTYSSVWSKGNFLCLIIFYSPNRPWIEILLPKSIPT